MGVHAGLYTQRETNRREERPAVVRPHQDLEGKRSEHTQATTPSDQPGGNMMYKEEMSQTAFAFIAGATVGAGVALLFAPRAGSELRSSVREYTRRAKDEWDQASQRGESALDTLAQRGKEWIQRAMPRQATGGTDDGPQAETAMGAGQSGGPSASGERA